jgi:hypothetical protein
MSAAAVLSPEVPEQQVAVQSIGFKSSVDGLTITDQTSYDRACSLLADAVSLRDDIVSKVEPPKIAAWKSYQASLKLFKEALEPLDTAITYIKRQIGVWEAKCQAEEERIRMLCETETVHVTDDSEPDIVYLPAQPIFQRSRKTTVSYRYNAEVVDIRALCRAIADGKAPIDFVVPNTARLNQLATAQRSLFAVPGCKLVKKQLIAQRRGI